MSEDWKCRGCGKSLEYCPYCQEEDEYGGEGQYGYYICQDKECEEYEMCCGC